MGPRTFGCNSLQLQWAQVRRKNSDLGGQRFNAAIRRQPRSGVTMQPTAQAVGKVKIKDKPQRGEMDGSHVRS
jgi:hypothetical protein